MTYETGVAIVFIGTVYLLFHFSDRLDDDNEWMQPLKLLTNIIGLFILLSGIGWAVKLQETTAGVDSSLYAITEAAFIAMCFVILPILMIFMIMFIKKLLENLHKMRAGDSFE